MKNKEFDQHIKQQLDSILPEQDSSSWVAFESMLDSVVNDDAFDKQIKDKVENTQQSYQESHWNLFLSHFAWVQLFSRDLIYNKAFEAVLLVLALAFVFPKQTTIYDAYSIAGPSAFPVEETYSSTVIIEEGRADFNFKHDNAIKSELSTTGHFILNESQGTADVSEFNYGIAIGTENYLVASSSQTVKEADLLKARFSNLDIERKIFTPTASSKPQFKPLVNELPFKDFTKLVAETSDFELGTPLIVSTNSLSSSRTIVSVFTTMDINTIHTPYDAIYLRNGYEQSKFGVGGGFSIGWNKSRWTLEAGMSFSMKQYNPRTVLEIFRFNPNSETAEAISLRAIELNTLSIPLHLRFDVYQGGRFTPYLMAGLGLNLATHANYDREQFKIALAQPLPPDAQVNPGSTPRLDEKKFSDGIIQGGSFRENYFLSFNSGLGLDYQLGKQWRLFAEVSYHYNFMEKELGPNNDRINTFSFKLGGRHVIQK